MRGTAGEIEPASSRVATLPNLLSLFRIVTIPVFCWLLVHRATTTVGLVLFAIVVATDWVDGYVARRTGQVTELGRILDPTADRLAIAAGLIALVVRGVFPLWAALLIMVRDAATLVVAGVLLAGRRIRLDVRTLGKIATFSLMTAVPAIAWGNLGLPLDEVVLAVGWVAYAVGILEYYLATVVYAGDLRRAMTSAAHAAVPGGRGPEGLSFRAPGPSDEEAGGGVPR